MSHEIFEMPVADVYPQHVTKLERKGRTEVELREVTRWLTGYADTELDGHVAAPATFRGSFADARLNAAAPQITGVICGVRVEGLARGKAREKVLRSAG